MEISFKGKMPLTKLLPNVAETLVKVFNNIEIPDNAKIKIEDVALKVVVSFNDTDNYLTVTRDIEGESVDEMLALHVDLDDVGNIKYTKDNEEESFYDTPTIQAILGMDRTYDTIVSPYKDEELEQLDMFEGKHNDRILTSRLYRIIESGRGLLRYYVDGNLVSESEVVPEFFEGLNKEKGTE